MEPLAAPANHPGARSSADLRYAYDPCCSRPPGGGSCDDTILAVARALGLTFEEIEDPGGCASRSLPMNGIPAYARVGRLLTLAARQLGTREGAGGLPAVVTPCSDGFLDLSRASHSLGTHPDLRGKVAEELAATGLAFEPGPVRVRHLLDVLYEDAGTDAVRAQVRKPLAGLRVAPYTGCLTTRSGIPGPAREAPEPAARLEELLSGLGAEIVEFPLKAHCCGGRAVDASEETATSLQHRILRSAADRDTAVIAAVCTRCVKNLASGQDAVNRRFHTRFSVAVRHFTDLMADAFGVRS